MKNLSLYIGCSVVAQIKNGKFLILKSEDDFGMTETDLAGFKNHLESFRHVCTVTWSERLKKDYAEICSEVGL